MYLPQVPCEKKKKKPTSLKLVKGRQAGRPWASANAYIHTLHYICTHMHHSTSPRSYVLCTVYYCCFGQRAQRLSLDAHTVLYVVPPMGRNPTYLTFLRPCAAFDFFGFFNFIPSLGRDSIFIIFMIIVTMIVIVCLFNIRHSFSKLYCVPGDTE